jgi:hypothetical protein
MRHIAIWCAVVGMMSAWSACQSFQHKKNEDRLLAKVHNKSLFLSELDGMFPDRTTGEDSSLIINAYVERWVREALLLYEAERNIPSDLNIDKLVRDYRASLIRHNYEKILVEQLLDSTVTTAELVDFYQKHFQQYQLESPIVRCYFVKIPASAPKQDDFKGWWSSSSRPESYINMVEYASQNAQTHLLEDSVWYRIEDIVAAMPPATLSPEQAQKRELTLRHDDYQYYLKIFEVKNKNEVAPLGFVEDQVRKAILRNRKMKLMEDKKEEMYELEMRRNNIQIYTQ